MTFAGGMIAGSIIVLLLAATNAMVEGIRLRDGVIMSTSLWLVVLAGTLLWSMVA